MNQRQRDYAINRINEAKDAKIAAVTEKFTTQETVLSGVERVALIRAGKVKLLQDRGRQGEITEYTDLRYAFDFSKHESPKKFDSAKADPIIVTIKNEARKAKDNIMLAGDAEALKAIEDFEKTISKF